MQHLDKDQDPGRVFSSFSQKTQTFTFAFSFQAGYIGRRHEETGAPQWRTHPLSGDFLTKPAFTEPPVFLNTGGYRGGYNLALAFERFAAEWKIQAHKRFKSVC